MSKPYIHGATGPTRRAFFAQAGALGLSALLGDTSYAAAEPAPETMRVRVITDPAICLVPQYLARELLRLEGFTTVEYVATNYKKYGTTTAMVAAGDADITADAAINLAVSIDAMHPVTVLSGVHIGCWELFGGPRVGAVRDLKGKRVPIGANGAEEHLLTSSLLAYLGMDPRKDVEFVVIESLDDQVKAFAAGDVDAIFAFPPQPPKVRATGAGHVLIDSTRDRPWSLYFCCMAAGNRNFVSRYPVATKRALRALLKAADICASDPQRAARYLVTEGHEPSYDAALEVLRKVPFGRWRTDNPEDTLRFHALRLREVGMIKSSPQKLIAEGTDWRFLNELKRELKS